MMEIFLAIVLFLVGALIVAKGADLFVDASTWVSDVTGISRVLIGATVVAIATSGPELFVSLFATLQGQADMSTGNVVGSHLCNLGIGFALIAIFRPAKNSDKLYLINGLLTMFTAALLLLFYFLGAITFVHGIILLLIYGVFTFINIRFNENGESLENGTLAAALEQNASTEKTDVQEQASQENVLEDTVVDDSTTLAQQQTAQENEPTQKGKREKKPTNKKEIIINILKFAIGLTGIILGSKLIVDKATVLAKAMGISEMLIGLTIVAIGTSLPEIVTTIAALIKKESDLGIGNLFGSCVFNNSFIIPIAAFISGKLMFDSSVIVDLPVAIFLTLLCVIPTAIGKKIYRWQGIAVAATYVGYLVYLGITA